MFKIKIKLLMAGDYFNIKKTTFVVNILVYIKPLNSMEAQKHGKKEKLSAKKASLYLLVIRSMLKPC